MEIFFTAEKYTPRLRYIADFLLGQVLGFEVRYADRYTGNFALEGVLLEYGVKRQTETALFIPAHPFLAESNLSKPGIDVKKEAGLPAFFFLPEIEDTDLPFDLFAMAFYLLSRFEEYGSEVLLDHHDRFSAKASLAFQHGFLRQPLIDQWATKLYELLQHRFPFCPNRKLAYRFQSTIDVDYAWAYLHKGWKRTVGGFIQSMITRNWQTVNDRMAVWLGRQNDPYYTFDYLQELHQNKNVKPLFFILLAQHGVYDKNISPSHPAMQSLIQKLGAFADMGIHPSYASNKTANLLTCEKKTLERILDRSISKSRQHFLKLRFPETYHRLIAEGISAEYSMGYADDVGFRASTAYPFYWYDLEKESVTKLRIFPFAVMDVTLKDYIKLEPIAAIDLCADLVHSVKKTGGQFALLWHNSSFSEEMGWAGWKEVYEKVLALSIED